MTALDTLTGPLDALPGGQERRRRAVRGLLAVGVLLAAVSLLFGPGVVGTAGGVVLCALIVACLLAASLLPVERRFVKPQGASQPQPAQISAPAAAT